MARALCNGTVWINDQTSCSPRPKTGRYRRHGLGRLHGVHALIDFTEVKHIYTTTRRDARQRPTPDLVNREFTADGPHPAPMLIET